MIPVSVMPNSDTNTVSETYPVADPVTGAKKCNWLQEKDTKSIRLLQLDTRVSGYITALDEPTQLRSALDSTRPESKVVKRED